MGQVWDGDVRPLLEGAPGLMNKSIAALMVFAAVAQGAVYRTDHDHACATFAIAAPRSTALASPR